VRIDKDLFNSDLTILLEFIKTPVMCQKMIYQRCIFSQSHARKRLVYLETVGLVTSNSLGRRRDYHLTRIGELIAQELFKIQEILDDELNEQISESYPLTSRL